MSFSLPNVAFLVLSLALVKDATAVKPLSVLETETAEQVEQCIADPASTVAIEKVPGGSSPLWAIPLDITGQPQSRLLNLQPPIVFGDGTVLPQGLPWLSSRIPPTFDETNEDDYTGLPPKVDEPMLPPFFHLQDNPSVWGYNKWPALPFDILSYFRLDPDEYQSADDRNTLFLKNLVDRGPDNLLKKQYMSALTCDKMPLYEKKIRKMLQQFAGDITSRGAPVLSTWRDAVFELYFSLHFGDTEVPSFVKNWVDDIATQLAFQINGGSTRSGNRERSLRNYCVYPAVNAWIEERRLAILDKDDTSTFIYWWDKAGVAPVSVVFEAAHNVVAFSQFVNTLFLLVRGQLQNVIGIKNMYSFLQGDAQIGSIDFFEKYSEAITDNEKLDVTREAFRLLLPNFLTYSYPDLTEESSNAGKRITDSDFSFDESFHFHILIQAMNDEYSVQDGSTKAGTYDTSRYSDFQPPPANRCPYMQAQQFNVEDFGTSEIDGERIVPKSHQEYFPVFASGALDSQDLVVKGGPKYCPFGLGYRKCPAELFNSFFLEKMLDALSDVVFSTDGNLFGDVGPDTVGWDTAVPIGLAFALDNIYASKK